MDSGRIICSQATIRSPSLPLVFVRRHSRPLCQNPTDEPNRCSLRQQTPKRPRKPLYLGFFACGRPPQIVCLAWLDFPVPGPPSRQQKPEQNRWHPPRYWSPFTSVERRVRGGFPRSRVESRRFVQNRAHFFPCRTSNSGSGQRKGTI
jgi:hypothetical protein